MPHFIELVSDLGFRYCKFIFLISTIPLLTLSEVIAYTYSHPTSSALYSVQTPSTDLKTEVLLFQCPENSVVPDSADISLLNSAVHVLKISAEADLFWQKFWQNMDSFILAIPNESVLLVTNSNPPEEFNLLCGRGVPKEIDGISYIFRGTHHNISASKGLMDIIYPLEDRNVTAISIRKNLSESVEFLFHEAFHAFQRSEFPLRNHSERATAEIYNNPNYSEFESVERSLLHQALEGQHIDSTKNLIRAYLSVRQKRLKGISNEAINAEREIELIEGTAQVMGIYAGLFSGSSFDFQNLVEEVQSLLQSDYENAFSNQFSYRNKLYGTGAALVLLLDRFDINWQKQITVGKFLDEIIMNELDLKPIDDESKIDQILKSY